MKRLLRVMVSGVLIVGMVAVACKVQINPKSAASWQRNDVSYTVTETPVGEAPRSFDLSLAFSGSGVQVSERGRARAASLASSGRLALNNPSDPVVLYELPVLSVLPPQAGPVAVGQKWTVVRPSDAEVRQSDAIVGQERFEYEITEVTKDRVKVKISGSLRIGDSQGLDTLLASGSTLPPALAKPFISKWSPYLTGTAEFDSATGSTIRAEGSRVPFGFFRSGAPVANDAARLDYQVVRR